MESVFFFLSLSPFYSSPFFFLSLKPMRPHFQTTQETQAMQTEVSSIRKQLHKPFTYGSRRSADIRVALDENSVRLWYAKSP